MNANPNRRQSMNQPQFGDQPAPQNQPYVPGMTGQTPVIPQGNPYMPGMTGQMPVMPQGNPYMPGMTGQMPVMPQGDPYMPGMTGQMPVMPQGNPYMPGMTGQTPVMPQGDPSMPGMTGQMPVMPQTAVPAQENAAQAQPASDGADVATADDGSQYTGAIPLAGASIPGDEESAAGADGGAASPEAEGGTDEPQPERRFIPTYDPQQEQQQGQIHRPRGRRISGFQLTLILLCVLGAGLYAWWTLSPATATTAVIQAGTLGATYSGSALIVRNEVPYEAEGVTSIQYTAAEGKSVSRGMEICNVYSAGYSTKEMNALQDYRDQIRDYQLSLIRAESTYDAKMDRVNNDVLARAREVRDILAGSRGNLTNQERLLNAAIDARQQYIASKYATDQRLSRLLDDEAAQMQRIDSWTKQYAATADTLVSFYSDGYEYGLTMENYDTFTPAQVRRMIGGAKPDNVGSKTKTTIYRTIRDDEWVVLFLVDQGDQRWNPVEGQTYQLQLERFENTLVTATVETFTRTGGELLVRLRVNSSVSPVLYMRSCQATLRDQIATLKVPSRAIYQQDGMNGVVVVYGGTETFIPIQLVYEQDSYAYITAVTAGLLFEGQTVLLF